VFGSGCVGVGGLGWLRVWAWVCVFVTYVGVTMWVCRCVGVDCVGVAVNVDVDLCMGVAAYVRVAVCERDSKWAWPCVCVGGRV